MTRLYLTLLAISVLAAGFSSSPSLAAAPEFERDIFPLLSTHCIHCHGGLKQEHGLDLRTIGKMTKGGESGSVIDQDKPLESLIWQKVSSDEMPKTLIKLSAAEKATLKAWLEAGLPATTRWQDVPVELPAGKQQPAHVAKAIDGFIDRALTVEKIEPAPICTDTEFLRRVTLDIIGRLPTPEAARAFVESTAADKRAKLVDEFLARPEYGQYWARELHHVLVPLQEGRRVYDLPLIAWLAERFNGGASWQEIATQIVAAEGSAEEQPAVTILAAIKDPDKISQRVAKVFLGADMECAECHDHPYKPWRLKDDYWAMTSFFTPIRHGKKGKFITVIDQNPNSSSGKTGAALLTSKVPDYALVGGKTSVPSAFLGGLAPPADMKPPYRAVLANWLTGSENSLFAGAAVNRWWAQFFGRGLVNPVADFHDGNPPTHPEVLRLLAHEFAQAKFDCRHLIRCITLTAAYQRSSEATAANDDQEDLYGRMPLRPVSPDVLYDLLGQSLGVEPLAVPLTNPMPKREPPVTPRELFVNTFKQGEEGDRRQYDHGVLQSLQFINWNEFNSGGAIVPKLLEQKLPPEEMLDELYLRTLSRRATATEREKLLPFVAEHSEAAKGWSAVLWMLVNGKEFVMNH